MKIERPLILVTNDDSIKAKGIHVLIEAIKPLGDVVVVASEEPMSGMAHAITVDRPLRLRKYKEEEGIQIYASTGTPVDCVKLGSKVVLNRKPDLLVSGINHGSNASVNVIYSGTMAAVLEGCMSGIPSIGFSLLNFSPKADFSACVKYVRQLAKQVLEEGLPKGVCLNVNIPDVKAEEIKGVKLCRQSDSHWEERFDARKDPFGRDYYWLTGEFVEAKDNEGTDVKALNNNYVSVVPIQFDLTAHQAMGHFEGWTEKMGLDE